MDNTRKVKNILTAVCLLILLFLGLNADHVTRKADWQEATAIHGLYVDGCPSNGLYDYEAPDSIKWFYQDGQYYVFLPSGIDSEELSIYLDADGFVRTADGQRLNSGYNSLRRSREERELKLLAGQQQYGIRFMQSENLDSFYIETDSGNMEYIHEDKDNEEEAYLLAIGADQQKQYDGAVSRMKGRGNSTWSCDKKSYSIKLSREADLLQNEKLHENWVLQANSVAVEFRESLLRNAMAFSLAWELDETGNGIQYKFINLYLNGEYAGVYQLCEKIQIGDNGISVTNLEKQMKTLNNEALSDYAINEFGLPDEAGHRRWSDIPLSPADSSGGYLLEMDGRYLDEPSGFDTNRRNEFTVKSPKYCSFSQMGYIADLIQDLEDAIYAPDGYNQKGYSYLDYIDLESFAEYYALSELLINPDTYRYSTFLYKDTDTSQGSGKIYAGPVWDFDRCAGGVEETRNYATLFLKKRPWIEALLEKEEFRQELKRIYTDELRPLALYMAGQAKQPELKQNTSMFILEDLAKELEAAAEMNQIRWAGKLPTDVSLEAEEISAWLAARVAWLDGLEADSIP